MSLRQAVSLHQHRGNVLHTAPTSEPVSAAELRLHLRTDATDFPDAASYVTDARQEIEERSGLAFLTQTWRLALDRWPAGGEQWWDGVREGSINDLYGSASLRSVEMPKWPLASITSVTVYDEAGNSSAVTVADVFDLDLYRRPGRLTLKRGAVWPVALRASNAIEILYVAGYTSAANVPSPMKRAIKQLAAYLYAHRGDDCDPAEAYVASGAESLMAQYKPARL
jgi:hypothetical protein